MQYAFSAKPSTSGKAGAEFIEGGIYCPGMPPATKDLVCLQT